jgi:hypothetical protein
MKTIQFTLLVVNLLTGCTNQARDINSQPTSLVAPATPTPQNGTTQVF